MPEQAIITEALQRFREVEEAEGIERRDALSDLRFLVGEQWEQAIKVSREADHRPCLTINKLPKILSLIVNEQRYNRPAIQISPIGSGADKQTAEVIQGLIRHIEDVSEAEAAYDYGYTIAVATGKAFWRVKTVYLDDGTDNQEARIERIRNRFSVYFDPFCQSPTFEDARYCFIVEDIPTDDYKRRFPRSKVASFEAIESIGDRIPQWFANDCVRVAEYWHVEYEDAETKSGRKYQKRKIVCTLMNAVEVLDETVWPGTKRIPIVPVVVWDLDVDGKRSVFGMIRFAQDAQKQYNFMRSAATETVALAPRAPFVVANGQIEGFEEEWASANVRNWPYLTYNPKTVAGQPAPPPQRQAVEPPIQAIGFEGQVADNDLKDVTGVHEPQMGQPGPEQSSKAILARQIQGSMANAEYSAALARAIKATGEILVDIIPVIYDAPRIERIVNPDGTTDNAVVYNSAANGLSPQEAMATLPNAEGVKGVFDLGSGRYHVRVSSGPSYETRRQEGAQAMFTLINSFPQIIPLAGDVMLRYMDWPGADDVANRLQAMLPPPLQKENNPAAFAMQLQQQNQQLTQQVQELTQKLQAAMETIIAKRVESESRERIASENAATRIIIQELKSKVDAAQAQADRAITMFQAAHEAAHEQATQAAQSVLQAAQPQPQQPPVQTPENTG